MQRKKDNQKKSQRMFYVKPFGLLLLGGALVLAVAILLSRNPETKENIPASTDKPRSTRPADPTPLLNHEPDFNKVTRVFTSPIYDNIPQFTVKVPQGWEVEPYGDVNWYIEFKSTDNAYSLAVNNGPRGSRICYFSPDRNDTYGIKMTLYREINTDFGMYRIGEFKDELDGVKRTNFLLCQQGEYTPKEWMPITDIGTIGFVAPDPYSDAKIQEMVSIIEGIKIIK